LVDNGVPLPIIKDLLGHNSIKTTEVYLHISNKFRKEFKSPLDILFIKKMIINWLCPIVSINLNELT
jgi:integrase/recombinase XerD